jgi:chemotaxis protein CheZ
MSSDRLPVPDHSATPREDADYEAVHAVLKATARGRKFLTEYIARREPADARKPADSVGGLEAAIRDNLASPGSDAFVRGLAELVAAIEQIGAGLAGNASLTADTHFAVELIQDIAMALRQRDVEATLCDGLDAAIREVGDAIVRSEAADARADDAAVQLHELARRIADMTAVATASVARADPVQPVQPMQPLLPVPSPMQGEDESPQAAASSSAAVPPQRTALRDPLAALHALSEEELIALFS